MGALQMYIDDDDDDMPLPCKARGGHVIGPAF